jgi:GNAT superfamily N-acetyltransferase
VIDLQPFDGQQATDAEIDEYHEFRSTVYLVDYPEMPAPTRQAALSRLREPDPDLGEQRRWTVRLDGRLAAWVVVALLDEPRAHLAEVQITVHPGVRRRGIGTEILQRLAPMLRGRTLVQGWNVNLEGAGGKWAQARGFRVVHAVVCQILDFGRVDPATWDVAVPAGYRLVRWIDAAPEELVDSYAKARGAIADAPVGEASVIPSDWSVERVRRVEADYREGGFELRVVVAVDSRGEVVGLTELKLRRLDPGRLRQGDTAVLAAHRGHGLGVAMKAAMLRWFTADVTGLRDVWTNTGAANKHMIDVNRRLGFETASTYAVVSREL